MIIEKAIKKAFTPEFLNRLDEQILFNPLTREDIEKMLDAKVFLDLYVRVKENWRDSEFNITNLGYTEDN